MATDNNQNNDRIDRLEAIMQMVAETQRQLVESAQRHDMEMEMLRAIQRDQAATQQDQAATQEEQAASQEDQAASIKRHEDLLQILVTIQQRQDAAIERHDIRMEMLRETQNQVVNLVQSMASMLHGAIDTQQEHSNDIRDLREGRDNAP